MDLDGNVLSCLNVDKDDEDDWEGLFQKFLNLKMKTKLKENELFLKIEELEEKNKLMENSLYKIEKENKVLKIRNAQLENSIGDENFKIENLQKKIKSENKIEKNKKEENNKINEIFDNFKINDLLLELDKKKSQFYSSCSSIDFHEETESKKKKINSHLDSIRDFCLMEYQNEKYIISVSEDCLVNLYNIKNKKQKFLRSHLGPIFKINNCYTNDFFLTGGCEGIIKKWDLQDLLNKNEIYIPKDYFFFDDCITSLEIHPFNNNLVLSSSADCVNKIFDLKKNKEIFFLKENYNQSIFNKFEMEKILLTVANKPIFSDFNLKKNFSKEICLIENWDYENQISSIDFNFQKNLIIFGLDLGNIIILDKLNKEILIDFDCKDSITCVKTDDNFVYVSSENGLKVFDIRKKGILKSFEIGDKKFDENLTHIEIDLLEDILYVSSVDGNIYTHKNYLI